jgi:flagellar biosynthetic protein FliP
MTPTLRRTALVLAAFVTALCGLGLLASPAAAAPAPAVQATGTVMALPAAGAVRAAPAAPAAPVGPAGPAAPGAGSVKVEINGVSGKPSSSLSIILALTVLSVAPALLLMCTCFTKVFVVLGLTRNALGLTNVPPNQVLAGLALFISLFIMAPTLTEVNDLGVQPYLKGEKTQSQAFTDGVEPLRKFMVAKTRKDELALFTKVAGNEKPKNADEVPLTTLVPAFVLSELKSAFIIGFVIFIPFLIIDLIVSAALMSMGMMMLPPVMISLPFKLLLFVLVDGWGLVVKSLVSSYA